MSGKKKIDLSGFDEEVSKAPKKAIDLSAFDEPSEEDLAVKEQEGLEKKFSKGKSALKGAEQGLTFGFADEIGAGIETGLDKTQALMNYFGLADESPSQVNARLKKEGFTGDIGPTSAGEYFDKSLSENRKMYDEAKKANPKSFMGGNIAGGLAPAVLTGGGSMGLQAAKGAAQGALAGFGNSEDKFSKQGLVDTAIGGGLGGIAPVATKGLGKGLGFLADKTGKGLKSAANSQAVRSLGFGKNILKEIEGKDAMDDLGNMVLKEKLITPFAGAKYKDEAVKKLLSKSGKTIGDSFDELQNAGGAIDTRKLQQEALAKLSKKFNPTGELVNTEGDKALVEGLEQFGGKPIVSLKGAHAAQQSIDDQIYSKASGGLKNGAEASREMRRALNEQIMDEAKQTAGIMNKPELFSNLQDANKTFGLGKMAEKLTSGKLASENSNKMFGLTDTITGVGGMAALGPKGLAVLGAKKYADKYGAQQSALVLDAASRGVNKLKDGITNQKFGKFSEILGNAMSRGDSALNATHWTLMNKDPEYRQMYNENEKEGEENGQ